MSNKLPRRCDIKFTVAEDVRNEASGRFTLLGVLPGERFAVGGPAPTNVLSTAFVLSSLALVFVITGGQGKYSGRLRITAPDGKTTVADSPIDEIVLVSGRSSVLANTSKPFVGPRFGTYRVTLEIGKAKFMYPLTIEKAADPKPNARRDRTSEPRR